MFDEQVHPQNQEIEPLDIREVLPEMDEPRGFFLQDICGDAVQGHGGGGYHILKPVPPPDGQLIYRQHPPPSMLKELWEDFKDRVEVYTKEADFEMGVSPSGLEDHYKIGDQRMQKDAAMYSLQLAFDARAEGEIGDEEYREIEDMAYDHVREFYLDEDRDTELQVPDVDRHTTEFRYHGFEEEFHERYRDVDFEDIDTVVAVASSGMEPGMVAAALNDTDYHIVRYSHRRLDDGEVLDFDPDHEDERIALVDDEAYTGKTITQVRLYLEQEAAEVREEPFRDTRDAGLGIFPLSQWLPSLLD